MAGLPVSGHQRQRWHQVIRLRHASEDLGERYTRHIRNVLVILALAAAFLAGAAAIGVRDLAAQDATVLRVNPSQPVNVP